MRVFDRNGGVIDLFVGWVLNEGVLVKVCGIPEDLGWFEGSVLHLQAMRLEKNFDFITLSLDYGDICYGGILKGILNLKYLKFSL